MKALSKKKSKVNKTSVELIDALDLDDFISDEAERIYQSDLKAMQHGYKQSISSRPMTFPNERAHEVLKQIAARHIKSITETTRKQIKGIIADSFKEQVAVTEIASRIRDVFPDIAKGRASTIARTETLTAVSVGQKLKVDEFRKAYPDETKKMKRIWITAQDEKVRDQHVELDGVSVGIDDEFAPGLKFPRDPDCEDAGQVINCRCTTIEYFPEDEKEIRESVEEGSPLADEVDKAE